jgi:hypothetical protein
MKKLLKPLSTAFVFLLILSGCSNSTPELSMQNCGKDNFCYKNINFGKTRGKEYEEGIKDGCKTGEGTFTKNYYLSSTSKDYFDGWILGRSKCKQKLPNEGTIQEEINSKKRAEYEIMKLKLEQSNPNSDSEEGIVDKIIQDNEDSQDYEY